MRYLVLLALALGGLTAHAGGIAFEKQYQGKHPISRTTVTLEFSSTDRTASLTVENTLGRAETLRIKPGKRTKFETVFDLSEATGDEKKPGEHVATVVTTGDCQVVERLAVILPSGITIPMHATAAKD